MNSAGNKFLTFILTVAFLGLAYWSYAKYYPIYFAPCSKPLTYTIKAIDPQFGLSHTQMEQDLAKAENIWEQASGHDLFAENSSGKVSVNLVYDYRQQAMDRLKSLGITIDSTKQSYDSLDAQYKSKLATYDSAKSQLTSLINQYNALNAKFQQDLAAYNKSKRTQSQYNQVKQEQDSLNSLGSQINSVQDRLKPMVDDLNALVDVLNQQAKSLNLNVNEYNQIGQTTGSEFQEGVYTADATQRSIDIYEFTNQDELVRVLAHELGHALGLHHVDDPNAIMYKINQSTNAKPTAADLAELARVCKF